MFKSNTAYTVTLQHMKMIIDPDNIPSFDGVVTDWEYKPINLLGRRAVVRVKAHDIPRIFVAGKVFVKIITFTHAYMGRLLDIGTGGLAMQLPVSFETGKLVRMGFYLGPVKIISKAQIKYSYKTEGPEGQEQYITGVEFFDLDSESVGYINGLYASVYEE